MRNIQKMRTNFLMSSGLVIVLSCIMACSTARKNQKGEETGFFKNEIRPVKSKPCFEGAYYRKLVSSTDDWVGINGIVVLPTLEFDEARRNPKKPMQFLDNPSIYFGCNTDEQETDIGLSWEIVKDEKGVVSKDRKAFRPFLRRNEYADGQKAVFENAPATAEYYWYPGDTVTMTVKLVADKTLRFTVEGAGKKFEKDFTANAFLTGRKAEYKRVNAIDQVANEGFPVQPTKTKIVNAVWKETNLYRHVKGKTLSVPFHSGRYTEMLCPNPSYFKVIHSDTEKANGAETFTISGSGIF